MPTKEDSKPPKRRTQVKDLPQKEKALTADEVKKVKGGAASVSDTKHVLEKSGTIN